MTDDLLYQKLSKELEEDFRPVKPLANAWKRALWILPAALLCLAATLLVFHLRPDHASFHFLELWGVVAFQILVSYKMLQYALDTGIPGSIRNRWDAVRCEARK